MVDTIILRLHDLQKYNTLLRRIELKQNNGYTKKQGVVNTDEINKLRGMGYSNPRQMLNILELNKTGEFLVKTQFGKQVNRSNHYAFTYYIDWTNDFIEFNFSIPKYRFGTNVLMYVEHTADRDYAYYKNSTLEHNMLRVPKLVISFLRHFFQNEFPVDNFDNKDIEVHRIDVCFNQIFRSKEEALRYLEYQKKLKKKYARDEEGTMREYNTSIMYVTKRYSAKIYHKGSEYQKNDLKEHLRINEEKGHRYFKTEKFQAFADRMLRYELTIRNAELNSLFKNNLFRRNCPFFSINYRNYLRVENMMQRNKRLAKKIGTLPVNEKEQFLYHNPYEKISREDRTNHRHIKQLLEARTHFMLEISERAKKFNTESVPYEEVTALFSEKLIYLCLKKLESFIAEFQVKELPNEDAIIAMVEKYNLYNRRKLPLGDMQHFYDLILKHGSFKEAAKNSRYSRATIYRYKERFKKIGISDSSVIPVENYSIPQSKVDFSQYHSFLTYDCDFLRSIRIC